MPGVIPPGSKHHPPLVEPLRPFAEQETLMQCEDGLKIVETRGGPVGETCVTPRVLEEVGEGQVV
jgi:hypothetical protein